MVKDTLNSILDNIKERTTNPFLGTLIVVWLVKNWTLVYSLFYFDSSLKLQDRLDYISAYFAKHSFLINMVFVTLITLGVLVLTYFLLGVSRYLTETYERRLVPKISEWTDKTSIVLKADYIKIQEVVKQLEIRLEEERISKVAAQNERDDAYSKLITLRTTTEPSSEEKANLVKVYEEAKTDNSNDEEHAFRRLISIINQTFTRSDFNDTVSQIMSNASFTKTDSIIALLLRELMISLTSDINSQIAKFSFTDEGLRFIKYWNNYNHEADF